MRWLYTRAVTPAGSSILSLDQRRSTTTTTTSPSSILLTTLLGSDSGAASSIQIRTCLRLYILAHRLLVEELENDCADAAAAYYSVGTRRPDVLDARYVYERTPPGAGMRRLLCERLAAGLFRGRQHNPVSEAWRDVLNETPDLGFDIVSEVAGYHWICGGNAPARAGRGWCAFHRHEKGEVCRRE